MDDFEKLGAFYLGKTYDLEADRLREGLILYDSKDLTTHAVIIGMTGSGKTGLGIGMIEEAAMDRIPVIAIDPKGDLGNLLLTFPGLAPADFAPWVNPREASDEGQSREAFAKAQAALWKKGLAQWGQSGERIRALRERVEMAIYTPGSNAGLPVSVLGSFDAPPATLREDRDLYRERVQATATGILALLGIEADPVTSREHILIANLLDHRWREGQSLDVASLIALIQNPPLTQVGVLSLDDFYPAKERFGLALRLNNLLAAPGFEAWMEGVPLDAAQLLYTESGKPRVSVMSIAHLADAERMFFVAMLLNGLIGWMRDQPGTSSLRAILYMDEIFGYMPPVANPPSKQLLLTLLKQARAYGLGLVLSTQNPVDLDYKGLSNTGTWFIGRLQTERDKARVMEGLEGAAAGGGFDKARMEQTLAGLGKRRFLLHNVHEDEAVVFNTRWAMSYLPGPLTRDQIRLLMAERKAATSSADAAAAGQGTASAAEQGASASPGKPGVSAPAPPSAESASATPPIVPRGIRQVWIPAGAPADGELVYCPCVIAACEIAWSSARYKVDASKELAFTVVPGEGAVPVDWDAAEPLALPPDRLATDGQVEAAYAELPEILRKAKNYADWEKRFKRWLRSSQVITLYRSPTLKLVSSPGETEGEFRVRLQQAASEKRDQAVARLRKRYAVKTRTLERRLLRAEQAIERETEQSRARKLDTAISFGTAILGAVLGRKRLSGASARSIGSAVKKAGSMSKEAGDVERAKETAATVRAELETLNAEFEREVDEMDAAFDAQAEALEEVQIKPKATDVHVHFVGLGWAPYQAAADGRLRSVPAS